MNSEFHYYITGIIARRAGFSEEEAMIIAYSSQFVDNNTIIYVIKDKENDEEYLNYISQTYNILKPRRTLMRIYPIFHFVPGNPMAESARRKDGKMHILNTTPNNTIAQDLMNSAFSARGENRLYRIGIASHAYTDSWSHQNFVGYNDSFNGFSMNPIPNIGHADVILIPDKIGKEWTDSRLVKSKVKNNDRFISAAEHLFWKYRIYLGTDSLWEPLREELLLIMNSFDENNSEKRKLLYRKLEPWLLPYNKDYWFDCAIDTDIKGFKDFDYTIISEFAIWKDKYWWKEKKENTHWYKFQEAVKDHQKKALPLINKICNLMGVDIRLF